MDSTKIKMTPEAVNRFWAKVDVGSKDECWNWTGACSRAGRARFMYEGTNRIAARVLWEHIFGTLPTNICVCHQCDNPRCLNPFHLFLGTVGDNNRDSSRKGRNHNSRKTHCRNGHPLADDNVYYRHGIKRGRICKTCANVQSKSTYERSKL